MHRVALFLGLAVAGCADPSIGGGVDRSCLAQWPEECVGVEGTTGTVGTDIPPSPCEDAETMDASGESGEADRHVYSCLPRPESGTCPEAESTCAADAFDHRFGRDCRECLRVEVQVTCGPDPAVDDACCYWIDLDDPPC